MSNWEKSFTSAFAALNDGQKQAVETIEGPVMVLAGPGTGKTQVVALRIAQILQKTQLGPQNILALTFTEAGVTALRSRLSQIIGPLAYRVTIATFHGFANEVIGIFPHLFTQTQSLRQVSDPDRFLLIEEIVSGDKSLHELRPLRKPDQYVQEISARIKTCKQENISSDKLAELYRDQTDKKLNPQAILRQQEFVTVLRRYNDELAKRGWYDYEDTIQFVVAALRDNDEIRGYFQERYQYLLVDEYQDTNNSQNALVEALADFYPDPNLFVVGDDKQAIYRFQGASVANMLYFQQRYPKMKIITLTVNYRSTAMILGAASELISHNRSQLESMLRTQPTELVSQNKLGSAPITVEADSQISQYDAIISAARAAEKSGTPLSSIAVLFRRRQGAKDFSLFANKCGLAVSGQIETDLFNHPVTKSVLRLLTAIDRPTNNLALIAALRPILGNQALLELFKINRATRSATPLIEKLAKESGELGQAVRDLLELHRQSELLTVEELIEHTLTKYRFLQNRLSTRNILEATELILSLVALARNFALRQEGAELTNFLQYCQTIQSRLLEIPLTKLMPTAGLFVGTIHSAKGMEFEQVFMADADERSWSLRAKPELIKLPGKIVGLNEWVDDPVEDERRLFYVGITRAKSVLTLYWSGNGSDNRPQLPCQFLLELGELSKQTAGLSKKKAENLTKLLLNDEVKNQAASADISQFITEQIATSALSYSDLRSFQTCPQQYLFSRILRLPQPASDSLMYGSAVHKALELYFREYKAYKKRPSKQKFLTMIEAAVDQTVLPASREKILNHALLVLEPYWTAKASGWLAPVGIEYSFTHHHVRYSDIWLTGKFDRIDLLDGKTNAVRVVDYKTKSRPLSRNVIEGKTKNSDGEIKQQLIFYATLAHHDPLFPYRIKDFLVSVIDDKGDFRDEIIAVTPDEIHDMEKLIIATRQELLATKTFHHRRSQFDKGCEICQTYGLA
ncbi:MAG: ATP-dependent DNA helicase [Patescibacteria group bacterium]